MSKLTYKEFLDQVKRAIEGYSEKDLRNIILYWASVTEARDRPCFLLQLDSNIGGEKSNLDLESFLARIETFSKAIEDGDYCIGWGWDAEYSEEREWGDESWAEEMDEFFRTAQNLAHLGEWETAGQAYQLLFDTLRLGEEPGHFPGDPNLYNMLTIDVNEQLALFLRSLYYVWDPQKRPSLLLKAIREYGYLVGFVSLREVMECVDSPLPDQESFLTDWIELLNKEFVPPAIDLMREAVYLQDGATGFAKLASKDPDKYAESYFDWLTALKSEGDNQKVLQVAREGLTKTSDYLTIRAKIAEFIFEEGEKQNDLQLRLEGYKASFFANPKLKYLLDLYLASFENDTFEQIKGEVLQRIDELCAQKRIGSFGYHAGETTVLFNRVYYHTLILSGEYEQLFDLYPETRFLGWSDGNNPRPFLILVLLYLLSRGGVYGKVLEKQCKVLISENMYSDNHELYEKYAVVVSKIYENLELGEEQSKNYLDWCLKQVDARVNALLVNKYRTSYYKGAELVVVLAETLANLGERSEAVALINSYHRKYTKYSAFRRELRHAEQMAGIFQ